MVVLALGYQEREKTMTEEMIYAGIFRIVMVVFFMGVAAISIVIIMGDVDE